MTKTKMGRPKKKAGDVRRLFHNRYSANELKSYKRAAKLAKLPIRVWMRRTLDAAAQTALSQSPSKAS